MPVEISKPLAKFPAPAWIDFAVYTLIIGFAVMQLGAYQRTESFEPDSSFYIGLSQAMVQHGTYQFNFKPHILYPPGFPAILALLSLIFGPTYKVFILSMPLFGAAGLIIAYHLLRQLESRAVAAAACLLLGSTPYFFSMTTEIINADLPYLLTSMLTLLLAMTLEKSLGWTRRAIWIGFTLSLMATILIRTVGIALLFGLGAHVVISYCSRKRTHSRQIVMMASPLVLGFFVEGMWLSWTRKAKQAIERAGAGTNMTYLDYVGMLDPHRPELGKANLFQIVVRCAENLVSQSAHFIELISRKSWVDPVWYSPLVLGAIILVGIGILASIRQRAASLDQWYFAAYMTIYLLWPFDVGARFILPVFPLVFLYAWRGAIWLIRTFSENPWAAPAYGIPASSLLMFGGLATILRSHVVSGQGKLSIALSGMTCLSLAVISIRATAPVRDRLWRTVKDLWDKRRNPEIVLGMTVVVMLVGVGVKLQLSMAQGNLLYQAGADVHRPSAEAASWIAANTASNETIMAGEEAIVHRISGRKVALFPVTNTPIPLLRAIDRQGASFIIVVCDRASDVFPTEPERLRILTQYDPQFLRLVKEGPCYQVYKIADHSTKS